jgi:hypothetical protein
VRHLSPNCFFLLRAAKFVRDRRGDCATSTECSQSVTYEHWDERHTARHCKLNGRTQVLAKFVLESIVAKSAESPQRQPPGGGRPGAGLIAQKVIERYRLRDSPLFSPVLRKTDYSRGVSSTPKSACPSYKKYS